MAKEPDVSVRVRAINTNLDERHSGLGDIEVRVIHEGGKKYKVAWIPKGGYGYVTEFKKKGKYELYTAENFIQAVIYQATKIKLGGNSSIVDVNDYKLFGDDQYYEIIQNPFEQNPPLYRSFGNDPYYLNNKTKVSIFWFIGDKQSISRLEFSKTYAQTEAVNSFNSVTGNFELRATFGGTEGVWSGGALWSLPNGREKLRNTRDTNGEGIFSDGNTYDDKAAWGQIYGLYIESDNTYEDPLNIIEYKKYDIKKYVLIDHKESGEKFTLVENMTDFVEIGAVEIENQYGFGIDGEVLDVEILESILTIWKKKVADYDALDVCYKDYGNTKGKDLPKHFSCNEVEYRSPIQIEPKEPEPTPNEESVQTQGTPKIKLSVVLPEDFELKVKEDLDEVKIYIGDPPSDGFVFQDDFDNLEELDPEYMESDFEGSQEVINTPEEVEENIEIAKADNTGPPSAVISTGDFTCSEPRQSSDSTFHKNKVPYYYQYDTRWNYVIFGLSQEKQFIEDQVLPELPKNSAGKLYTVNFKGNSYKIQCDHKSGNKGWSGIGGGGCGPTSLAMVTNYWAKKNGKGVYTSPVKTAKMICDLAIRARPGPPCNGTAISTVASKCNEKLSELFGFKMRAVTKEQAVSRVKSGNPVIWQCRGGTGFNKTGGKKYYGGHYMVISEFRDSKFWVSDPGNKSGSGIVYLDSTLSTCKGNYFECYKA